MKMIIAALAAITLAMPAAALAGDKKTGQNYAPGQRQTEEKSAKEFAPGQVKKEGESAKKYAPGQKAQDANDKAGGATGSSSGTGQ